MAEGTPGELVDQMGSDTIRIAGQGDSAGFVERVREKSFVEMASSTNGMIQIGVDSGSHRLVEIVSLAAENGFRIDDISVAKPSLGDVFLKYTGREFRD